MFNNLLPGVPNVISPFFDEIFNRENFLEEEIKVAKSLNEKGYAIIDFPDKNINDIADTVISDLYKHYDFLNWKNDGFIKNEGMRLADAHLLYESVKKIALNKNIIKLLTKIYGREAIPFQTLSFPVGTQQHFHTDEFHFSTSPPGFMCGVWVALEDIHKDSGPLEYYAGSHKLSHYHNDQLGIDSRFINPSQNNYDKLWSKLVKKYNFKKEIFLPKKGQAIIWVSSLLHGGSRQKNPNLTRWSQVTHYFFDNCVYYSPAFSDIFAGSIKFIELKNISNNKKIDHKYNGTLLEKKVLENNSYKRSKENNISSLPTDFDAERYLMLYPDVKKAQVDPKEHFLKFGYYEGRKYK